MGQFTFTKKNIAGILLIEAKAFPDQRGYFMESYHRKDFSDAGFNIEFVQDNYSVSRRGVLRGLHYQIQPSPMGKLVRCVKGKIFDVGVDVRKGSPTFGRWYGEVLDEGRNKMKMIYFPPGIAHGFLALEEDSHVYYKCTGFYSAKNERAIIWNDPSVGIPWPLEQIAGEPILSDRDRSHPLLKDADLFIS